MSCEVARLRDAAADLALMSTTLVLGSHKDAVEHCHRALDVVERLNRTLFRCTSRTELHHEDAVLFRAGLDDEVSSVTDAALARVVELAGSPAWRDVLVRDAALATVAPLPPTLSPKPS